MVTALQNRSGSLAPEMLSTPSLLFEKTRNSFAYWSGQRIRNSFAYWSGLQTVFSRDDGSKKQNHFSIFQTGVRWNKKIRVKIRPIILKLFQVFFHLQQCLCSLLLCIQLYYMQRSREPNFIRTYDVFLSTYLNTSTHRQSSDIPLYVCNPVSPCSRQKWKGGCKHFFIKRGRGAMFRSNLRLTPVTAVAQALRRAAAIVDLAPNSGPLLCP